MPLPSFFLAYEDCSDHTLAQFLETLRSANARTLADVTIGDLCAMSQHPNGLYFFFGGTPNALQYVGKCTSRSFVERIPSHFDQRENAWFNTLPTKIAKNGLPYTDALAEALRFRVVLLGIRDGDVASALERIFRHTFKPILNTPRNLNTFDTDASLTQLSET